jgi:hypothetical protein
VSGDLRDLLGDDVPEQELARLREADRALRATPPPPEVPESLTAAVLAIPGRAGGSRRRFLAGLAAAAAIAGAAFGVGLWAGGGGGEGPPVTEQIVLDATPDAPREARMVIDVLPRDTAGNWAMAADVEGLPPLPEGGYYEVWMTKRGELHSSCGRFVVDEQGRASDVWLNAPYALKGYDRWVVVAVLPGKSPSAWLLDGPVVAPVA